MPVLCELYIDREPLMKLSKEELVEELVKARQLAYERGCTIERLDHGLQEPYYSTGQPYPYTPADGQW